MYILIMLAWFGNPSTSTMAQGTTGTFLGEFGSWEKCQGAKEVINEKLSKNVYGAHAMCFAK